MKITNKYFSIQTFNTDSHKVESVDTQKPKQNSYHGYIDCNTAIELNRNYIWQKENTLHIGKNHDKSGNIAVCLVISDTNSFWGTFCWRNWKFRFDGV